MPTATQNPKTTVPPQHPEAEGAPGKCPKLDPRPFRSLTLPNRPTTYTQPSPTQQPIQQQQRMPQQYYKSGLTVVGALGISTAALFVPPLNDWWSEQSIADKQIYGLSASMFGLAGVAIASGGSALLIGGLATAGALALAKVMDFFD